jgi:hypothetical protein
VQDFSSGPIAKNKLFYSVSAGYKSFELINNTFLNQKVDFSKYNLRANLKYIINKMVRSMFQDNFKIDAGGNYYVTKQISSIRRFHHWLTTIIREPFGDVQEIKIIKLFKQFKVEGNFSKSRFQSLL